MLDALTIEPDTRAKASVIWLHGLGADGYDFVDVIPALSLPKEHGIRFIFPHAPSQAVTLNGGMYMPAWFDIKAIHLKAEEDVIGIKKSAQMIQKLLDAQKVRGIPYEKMILMGFSQGGALALYTALRFPAALAGVAGLSTYLPVRDSLAKELDPQNKHISVFMAHGLMDPVVPFALGEMSCQILQNVGLKPAWHPYPMGHMVCLPELLAIGKWIEQCLK